MLNGASSLVSLLPECLQCKFPILKDIVISTAGVSKLLSDLNVSKAAGPDAIRPIVLKHLSQEISPVIALIFQTSLDSGTVPAEWKTAQVCPLFKKGDKTDPANYRPISLTCILCKTMEPPPLLSILIKMIYCMTFSTVSVSVDHAKPSLSN